jgi:hypothetical protein
MSEPVVFENLDEFNRGLDDFAEKTIPEEMNKFMIWLGSKLLNGFVKKTPIDTGRAQGNWQVTFHRPASGKIESYSQDRGSTIRKGLSKLKQMKADGVVQVVYITNNVDYIIKLEEGHSQRAPSGMVSVTLAEMESYLASHGMI